MYNSSTAVVDIVDIKEYRKLTPSDSKNAVVLLSGKLIPSVDYFWKSIKNSDANAKLTLYIM
jgi:hypothetical protein